MNIEKLGIKPLEGDYHEEIGFVFATEDIEELEQQRNEMLEALVRITTGNKRNHALEVRYAEKIIQKADPQHRSWQEIKELLND